MGSVGSHRTDLRGSQKLADPRHRIARIGAPAPLAPLFHLLGEIGRRLTGERRIGRPDPLAGGPVAGRTGRQATRWIAQVIQGRRLRRRRGGIGVEGQCRVIERDGHPFPRIQFPGNPRHLRMVPPSVRVCSQLPLEISGIEIRKPRSAGPVALSLQPMTSEAGVRGPRSGAAERYDAPVLAKAIARKGVPIAADQRGHQEAQDGGVSKHPVGLIVRHKAGFHCLLLSLAIAGCKPPPDDGQSMPLGDPANGLTAIERVGCGSCHTIPGLRWPQGKAGPALYGLADRALIAGKLPNRPDVLAAYIRDAPALVPGSAMPAMPVSEVEARDIAAYLYEKEAQ